MGGLSTRSAYNCCNLAFLTNIDGTVTAYGYDDLKRETSRTVAGITYIKTFDDHGLVVSTTRYGTNASSIVVGSSTYDLVGRVSTTTDAMGNVTTNSYLIDGSGQVIKTQTFPNGGTRIETYARDGVLLKISGTGVHGVRYAYGVEAVGGLQCPYVQEMKLNSNDTDTSEWIKNYRDFGGHAFKTVYPDNSYSQSYYNNQGQQWKQADPDGVVTLYQYNARGDQEYAAVDMNRNDTIDFAGSDRITRTIRDVVTSHGTSVLRSRSFVWNVNNSNTYITNNINESSVDGLISWGSASGLTNQSQTAYSGGYRYTTNTAPDGSYTVGQYQGEQLLSVTRKDSNGTQIGQSTFSYDAHGRQNGVADARTGTTSYTFNNADQLTSVTTPFPAQVTTNFYDNMNRIWKLGLPDGTYTTNEFLLTGESQRTKGSRTYPVEYVYDYAGRMKSLKTWQNYAGNSGAATTTWNYDSQRGFLTSKRYDDNTGPTYTNTVAGRLKSRTWARNLTTTYNYDNGGLMTSIGYSDGTTPNVTYTLDRLARPIQITDVGTRTLVYNAINQISNDTYSVSSLSLGSTIDFGYDTLNHRVGVTNQSLGTVYIYGYDAASRLQTVSAGNFSATYAYLANSSLVTNIVFQSNGVTKLTTTKAYDNLNRLTRISSTPSGAGQSDMNSTYAYNIANQRTSVTNADNARWQYQYDSLGQVTSGKKYWNDGTVVAGEQFEYSFDDIGNRKTAASGGDQYGAVLRYANYSVNSLNEYTLRAVPGYLEVQGAAASNSTVTVNNQSTYRKGEYFRTELVANNGSTAVWQSITNIGVLQNGTNADIVATNTGILFLPKTPEGFAYDVDGNLTNDGRWVYVWDAENRLTSMTANSTIPDGAKKRLDFVYDCQGRRLYKKVSNWNGSSYTPTSTNSFYWDGWNCIGEYSPAYTKSYLWGLDLRGGIQEAGGVGGLLLIQSGITNCFPAYDGNGNVIALVSATNGTVSASYEYNPFGELLKATGPMARVNPFRVFTKYQDDETDLLYYGYRYYNPSTGRWNSRDPMEDGAGGENGYGMVRNDPINFSDYLGLFSQGTVYDGVNADLSAALWAPKFFDDRGYRLAATLARRAIAETRPIIPNYNLTRQDWNDAFAHPDFKTVEDYVKAKVCSCKTSFKHAEDKVAVFFSAGDLRYAIGHVEFTLEGNMVQQLGGGSGTLEIIYVPDPWDFSPTDSDWRVRIWGRLYTHNWIPKFKTQGQTTHLFNVICE